MGVTNCCQRFHFEILHSRLYRLDSDFHADIEHADDHGAVVAGGGGTDDECVPRAHVHSHCHSRCILKKR